MADTRRAFICNDELWERFANEANRQEKVVDDLICEALEKYLQGFGQKESSVKELRQSDVQLEHVPPRPPAIPAPIMPVPGSDSYQPPIPPAPSYMRQNAVPQHQPYGNRQASSPSYGAIPPAPPAQVPPAAPSNYRRPPSMYENDNFNIGQSGPMRQSSMSMAPAVLPPAAPVAMPAVAPQMMMPQQPVNGYAVNNQNVNAAQSMHMSGQPPLYILFANQRYTVDKDKFIIGRSSQMADLVIRDGNISRKHCAIIFKGGAYYIKDLDSTNGIEYKGQRIDAKRIDEGDQFNICEFQFTFTYQG